jgi:quinol monooxygenase YgiN
MTTDNVQAFKAQAKKMKDVTENGIGTLFYDFFINEEKREVSIVEKYADDKPLWHTWTNSCRRNLFPKY